MRLRTRLDRLTRRVQGDPRQIAEWEAFFTALIAFGQGRKDVTPEMRARIHEEAQWRAGRGIPETIRGVIGRSHGEEGRLGDRG